MKLAAVINRNGEDITEIVLRGDFVLWIEASECVEGILSRIRKSDTEIAELS